MGSSGKSLIALLGIVLVSFLLNGLIFVLSYNHLATPYLSEAQRVANADFIMSYTAGGFLLAALVVGALFHVARK